MLLFCLIFFVFVSQTTYATPLAFAHGGKFKMLYDCRQRPQSVFLKDRLYIVYNGDAKPTRNGKGHAYPMLITYNPKDRSFSKQLYTLMMKPVALKLLLSRSILLTMS